MSTLGDMMEQAKPYTMVSGREIVRALEVCYRLADNPAKAGQAFAAYMFIATKRNANTLEASLSDSEAAKGTPKIRGEGHLEASGFRKSVKPSLRDWGLVGYADDQRMTRDGKTPTRYTFPMLREFLAEPLEPCGINNSNCSGCREGNPIPHPSAPNVNGCSAPIRNNTVQVFRGHPEQSHTTIPTSRRREVEESKIYCMEKRNKHRDDSLGKWEKRPQEACPYCIAQKNDVRERNGMFRCFNCKAEKPKESWYSGGTPV